MDVDGLPIIGPGVDYTQVGAIHQKRTLAFINHFITNTVSFLNKFSHSCELRLEKFDTQIQKLEASLSILEAKLSSISELENVTVEQEVDKNPERKMQYDKDETRLQDMKEVNTLQTEIANLQTEPKEEITMAANDSQYARFFRMIQVGVPVQAVRLKMQYEGLDPSILEE
ncbi:Coiled-coil domain-containing protein 53 [Zootermopsis nevadensis]|uniref:Coiled-coil domain-containing protein 53 n=1 Tax=Zootermopsis nevadensis TaxID=136037 RepID=A0A067R2C2_ZOONE|nr:Coiled-coil domain-containing protein 53 [Zootermopsis nevadensis]